VERKATKLSRPAAVTEAEKNFIGSGRGKTPFDWEEIGPTLVAWPHRALTPLQSAVN
jgi:hypothetical protein